jgi:hypothetical protein
MDKKTKKSNILIALTSACFLPALLMLYAVSKNPEQGFFRIPAYCLLAAGAALLCVVLFFAFKNGIEKSKKNKEYLTYPLNEITDFKKELSDVRASFEADTDKDKNRVLKGNYKNAAAFAKPYYDLNVVNIGRIYYGALVMANSQLFKKTRAFPVLPGVIVYSTDGYFESNPLELKKIAQYFFDNRNFNILRNEKQYFSNILLPADKTGGRQVYMTTLMIAREHLPQYRLCSGLFPVIAAPGRSTSVFIADCKYWTKDLIANFIHGNI